MNKDVVLGVIRHLLTAAGGAAATKGLTDSGTVEVIVGGLVALVGLVWSIVAKKKAAPAPAPTE